MRRPSVVRRTPALVSLLLLTVSVSSPAHAASSPSPALLSLLRKLDFKAQPKDSFSLRSNVLLPQGNRGTALVYTEPWTHVRRIAGMRATVEGNTVWMRGLVYQPSLSALPELGPVTIDSVLGDDSDVDLGFSNPSTGPNDIYLGIEYMLASWYHVPVSAVPDLIKRANYVVTGSFPTRVRLPDGRYVGTAPSYIRPGPPGPLNLRKDVRIVFRMHGRNEGLRIGAIPLAARLQIDGGLTEYRAGIYSDNGRLTFFKYATDEPFQVVSTLDYVTVAYDLENLLDASARQITETWPPAPGPSWEDNSLSRTLSGDVAVPLGLFLDTSAINQSIFNQIHYAKHS